MSVRGRPRDDSPGGASGAGSRIRFSGYLPRFDGLRWEEGFLRLEFPVVEGRPSGPGGVFCFSIILQSCADNLTCREFREAEVAICSIFLLLRCLQKRPKVHCLLLLPKLFGRSSYLDTTVSLPCPKVRMKRDSDLQS